MRECPWYKKQMTNTIKVHQEHYTTMRIYKQEDLKLTKADIDAIQKNSEGMEAIDFNKWLAYEQRILLDPYYSRNKLYHEDIINALEHLQSIYEGTERVKFHPFYEIEQLLDVAFWNMEDTKHRHERNRASWDDVMTSYDIYEILRETQGYLSFHTSHYGRIK